MQGLGESLKLKGQRESYLLPPLVRRTKIPSLKKKNTGRKQQQANSSNRGSGRCSETLGSNLGSNLGKSRKTSKDPSWTVIDSEFEKLSERQLRRGGTVLCSGDVPSEAVIETERDRVKKERKALSRVDEFVCLDDEIFLGSRAARSCNSDEPVFLCVNNKVPEFSFRARVLCE